MFKEYTIESFQEEYDVIGSYTAHLNISKDSDIVNNYFIGKHKLKERDLSNILKKINSDTISILMNMDVDIDFRGEGYGSQLLDNFLNETSSPSLLICDTSEIDWLQSWYESNGFVTVFNLHGFPIMYKEN